MAQDPKGDNGPALPGPGPGPGPLPPFPPNVELKTLWDVAKILIAVLVWYITADANKALIAAIDYSKLSQLGSVWGIGPVPSAAAWGGYYGIMQGLIQGVRVLVFFWAGPAFFLYLGPVLNMAFAPIIKAVQGFRQAWDGKVVDDGEKDPRNKKDPNDKKDPPDKKGPSNFRTDRK